MQNAFFALALLPAVAACGGGSSKFPSAPTNNALDVPVGKIVYPERISWRVAVRACPMLCHSFPQIRLTETARLN